MMGALRCRCCNECRCGRGRGCALCAERAERVCWACETGRCGASESQVSICGVETVLQASSIDWVGLFFFPSVSQSRRSLSGRLVG